jgi:hypothetical protein
MTPHAWSQAARAQCAGAGARATGGAARFHVSQRTGLITDPPSRCCSGRRSSRADGPAATKTRTAAGAPLRFATAYSESMPLELTSHRRRHRVTASGSPWWAPNRWAGSPAWSADPASGRRRADAADASAPRPAAVSPRACSTAMACCPLRLTAQALGPTPGFRATAHQPLTSIPSISRRGPPRATDPRQAGRPRRLPYEVIGQVGWAAQRRPTSDAW